MKKTKREFLKVFREKYHDQADFLPNPQAELAAVMAAESVGVVWEPEEEPLPERVSVAFDAHCPKDSAAVYDGEGGVGDYHFWVIRGHLKGNNYSHRVAVEAARRYNAWRELRHIASNVLDIDHQIGGRLLDILDGKEDNDGK